MTCHLNAAQIPTARRNRHSSNRAEEPILLTLLCGRPQLMKHTQALLDFSLLRNTTPHNRSLLPGGSACVYQNDHSSSQTGGRYVLCIPCIFYTRCCSSVPSSRRVHNYRQGARTPTRRRVWLLFCAVSLLSPSTQTYITTCPTELSSGKFPPFFVSAA